MYSLVIISDGQISNHHYGLPLTSWSRAYIFLIWINWLSFYNQPTRRRVFSVFTHSSCRQHGQTFHSAPVCVMDCPYYQSHMTSFHLSWVCCDWSQPQRTGWWSDPVRMQLVEMSSSRSSPVWRVCCDGKSLLDRSISSGGVRWSEMRCVIWTNPLVMLCCGWMTDVLYHGCCCCCCA